MHIVFPFFLVSQSSHPYACIPAQKCGRIADKLKNLSGVARTLQLDPIQIANNEFYYMALFRCTLSLFRRGSRCRITRGAVSSSKCRFKNAHTHTHTITTHNWTLPHLALSEPIHVSCSLHDKPRFEEGLLLAGEARPHFQEARRLAVCISDGSGRRSERSTSVARGSCSSAPARVRWERRCLPHSAASGQP